MLQGFRDFLLRGNVVELAVAVIIGAAFGQIIDGTIKGVIDPLIALAVPDNNLEKALVVGPLKLGLVVSAIVNFVMKAGVVYFLIVKPFGAFAARMAAATPPPPQEALLREIRDLLAKK